MGVGESCIVENLCMVFFGHVHSNAFVRYNDSDVTKSTQNMHANMLKLDIILFRSVNYVSMFLIKPMIIEIIIPAQFCQK